MRTGKNSSDSENCEPSVDIACYVSSGLVDRLLDRIALTLGTGIPDGDRAFFINSQ
jgi:hypothetical protein